MVTADANQLPLMRVAVPLVWGAVPEVAADPTGLQGYARSIRREACRFPYIDFKAAVCWLARWKCIYRFPLPILDPLWKGETPPHTRLPTGLRLFSSRLFGRPLQVTVRPMLRDRCPVCLSVCLSVALMYCGQTVGWIKIPLGREVGLSPCHIVLDGDPAPPQKGHSSPPFFGPCLLWPHSWMDEDTTWYGGRPRPRQYCVKWGPSSPTERDTAAANFRPTLQYHDRPSQQLLSCCLYLASPNLPVVRF